MRTKFWYVNCDICGTEGREGEGSRGVDNLSEYLAYLRKEGWSMSAGRDICMECNGNGPRERAARSTLQNKGNES